MKLATIETIDNVFPHPNAERLELVTVLGFQCVVQKDILKKGDTVVFIQPDTCLPSADSVYIWADSFRKYVGVRVKAIQIRGEWSEGLIIPLNDVIDLIKVDMVSGAEVSHNIGVTKFTAPEPEEPGAISSILPLFMRETGEDRFENLSEEQLPLGVVADITLKIDGKSATYYYDHLNDKFGVCGRSLEFDINHNNVYTQQVGKVRDPFVAFCKENKVSLALRGEVYGTGISQGGNNPHNKKDKSFACFNVYNITERKYETKGSTLYFLDLCNQLGIETVPVIERDVLVTPEVIEKYSKGVKRVMFEGKEVKFEGAVVKHKNGSFKIINKFYDSEK
jgi:RNA ligase (TIGR02306 family)